MLLIEFENFRPAEGEHRPRTGAIWHLLRAAWAKSAASRPVKASETVVLGAFFDDSGTHASSPVVAMGGLLGTEDQWDVFGPAWEQLLQNPLPGKPPLKQFHLSPCRAGRDEFRSYSLSERDHITYLFRRIIVDIELVTVATAIDKVAWDELVTGEIAEQLGDPLQGCFFKCMDAVTDIIRARKPGEQAFVFFDEGTRDRLEMIGRLYASQKAQRPEIYDVGFAPVSKVIALQGADMIAMETFQFAQQWILDPTNPAANPHFEEFRFRDLSAGLILDRKRIGEIVERVKAVLASG
jgi:hypothetical protein